MATITEYLDSIIITATQAKAALGRGDHEELVEFLGSIRDDVDAAEKMAVEKIA